MPEVKLAELKMELRFFLSGLPATAGHIAFYARLVFVLQDRDRACRLI